MAFTAGGIILLLAPTPLLLSNGPVAEGEGPLVGPDDGDAELSPFVSARLPSRTGVAASVRRGAVPPEVRGPVEALVKPSPVLAEEPFERAATLDAGPFEFDSKRFVAAGLTFASLSAARQNNTPLNKSPPPPPLKEPIYCNTLEC